MQRSPPAMPTRSLAAESDVQGPSRPKPRIAYLAKEILGWYEKEDDFIFATDGGHWDNLGLIEQPPSRQHPHHLHRRIR